MILSTYNPLKRGNVVVFACFSELSTGWPHFSQRTNNENPCKVVL